MKIQITKLIEFSDKCTELLGTKTLGAKLGYKINQIVTRAEGEKKYFQDTMQRIIDRYGEKNEDGTPKVTEDGKSIVIIPDQVQECNRELRELESIEVDLRDDCPTFTLDEIDSMGLTLNDQRLFYDFIKEE